MTGRARGIPIIAAPPLQSSSSCNRVARVWPLRANQTRKSGRAICIVSYHKEHGGHWEPGGNSDDDNLAIITASGTAAVTPSNHDT
jgi:hypothetical protein